LEPLTLPLLGSELRDEAFLSFFIASRCSLRPEILLSNSEVGVDKRAESASTPLNIVVSEVADVEALADVWSVLSGSATLPSACSEWSWVPCKASSDSEFATSGSGACEPTRALVWLLDIAALAEEIRWA